MPTTELNSLHFPRDHAVGWVKIPGKGPDPHNHWKLVGEAKGMVLVPADVPVRLIVDSHFAPDLSWLDAIGQNQLTELYLVQTDVNDISIERVARLGGIELLMLSHTYEQIGDAGIAKIKPLKNLRKLYLNGTDIGDAALACLGGMDMLEVLSIRASKVTDAGLEHLYGLLSLKRISFDTAYSGARTNGVSDKGLRLLREALPGCEIIL